MREELHVLGTLEYLSHAVDKEDMIFSVALDPAEAVDLVPVGLLETDQVMVSHEDKGD